MSLVYLAEQNTSRHAKEVELGAGITAQWVNEFGTVKIRLTDTPGYDAEGAVSPDGRHIVFTSVRSGDPEIWIMNSDGSEPRQLTNETGYDGGPFFSPDGTKIVFRASRPKTDAEIKKYKDLLSYNLVSPLQMELYTVNIDGSGLKKITSLGGSNWAPFYMPDNRRIIFSSNFNDTGFFGAFHLYIVDENGENLERVTVRAQRLGAARCPSYFIANNDTYTVYASDFLSVNRSLLKTCPRRACDDKWLKDICKQTRIHDLYPDFDLFQVNKFGNFIRRLTDNPGYDGDASVSSDGKRIVFTSTRNGDADLWIMNIDGTDLKQLTNTLGYEGGAKFSPDGKFIVFHASRPTSETERSRYKWLLRRQESPQNIKKLQNTSAAEAFTAADDALWCLNYPLVILNLLYSFNAVELRNMQIFIMRADGSDVKAITKAGINDNHLWPSFLTNQRILFVFSQGNSNCAGAFNIFVMNVDGSHAERVFVIVFDSRINL
ncbi:unnamed protein product [Gongylonema pulchrum]|uniref:DPPIV_N domain-containing protein n=1 Tax=Gongylonema pulchrum TaxID=637853 RepID=A0A183CUI3_9BILA|nr:unnamed protein product [Gongylonema pulchrum]